MGSDGGSTCGGYATLDDALSELKEELLRLREEDVLMLKQLIKMHSSLQLLKGKLRWRAQKTGSFTALLPDLSCPMVVSPPTRRVLLRENALEEEDEGESTAESTPTLATRASVLAHAHKSLGRVMSEPGRTLLLNRSISLTSEDEGEGQLGRTDSFASNDSEDGDHLNWSYNAPTGTSNLLKDMPESLRTRYVTSFARRPSNGHLSGSSTSLSNMTSPKNFRVKFICGGSLDESQETDA